jgi:hypothetical protein
VTAATTQSMQTEFKCLPIDSLYKNIQEHRSACFYNQQLSLTLYSRTVCQLDPRSFASATLPSWAAASVSQVEVSAGRQPFLTASLTLQVLQIVSNQRSSAARRSKVASFEAWQSWERVCPLGVTAFNSMQRRGQNLRGGWSFALGHGTQR